MTKALDEAIERAAKEMFPGSWDPISPEEHREQARRYVRDFLRDVLPGLFDGSSWIAPWKATEEMRNAVWRKRIDLGDYDPEFEFRDMRDAYLNPEQKD